MELRYCESCGDVIRVQTNEPLGPTTQFICDSCKAGASRPSPAPSGSGAFHLGELAQAGLNLFSPETVAVKKKELERELAAEEPKSTHLRLVKSGAAGSLAPAQGRSGPETLTHAAQKLLFRCLYCRSTLSIRPVEKTSRLTCPHCTGAIYVTPAGKLHKNPPSVGRAQAQAALALPPTSSPGSAAPSGSVRLKPASTASRKTGSAAVRTPPAYPEPTAPAASPPAPSGSQARRGPPQAQPAPAGSVRLKLGGSQAVRRPPDPAHAPAVPAPPQGSVRMRSQSGRVPAGPAGAVPAHGPSTPPSPQAQRCAAFREHQARHDPEKTAFITDESTSDLGAITANAALRGVREETSDLPSEGLSPNLASSTPLEALLPDEDDLLGSESESTPSGHPVRGYSLPPAAAAKRSGRSAATARTFLSRLARAAFLVVCLGGPVFVVEVVSSPSVARAQGFVGQTCTQAATLLERAYELGQSGLKSLLNMRAP